MYSVIGKIWTSYFLLQIGINIFGLGIQNKNPRLPTCWKPGIEFVELAGFEPASGQSAVTPSTCLFSDWVFERAAGSETHPCTPYPLEFRPAIVTFHRTIFKIGLIRGTLYMKPQAHGAMALLSRYNLGGHGERSVAS